MNQGTLAMTTLRVLTVSVLLASCFDATGVHSIGTFPVTGGGSEGAGGGTAVVGGGSAPEVGGGFGTIGGGTGGGFGTPGPCNCEVADLKLTMSWECFCAKFGCEQFGPTCGNDIESSIACGLRVLELHGPQRTIVIDDADAVVGAAVYSDTLDYVCPDNASLHAFIARGGIFPDAGCSTTACSCADGGVICP
jgi:hypothetical protein